MWALAGGQDDVTRRTLLHWRIWLRRPGAQSVSLAAFSMGCRVQGLGFGVEG